MTTVREWHCRCTNKNYSLKLQPAGRRFCTDCGMNQPAAPIQPDIDAELDRLLAERGCIPPQGSANVGSG